MRQLNIPISVPAALIPSCDWRHQNDIDMTLVRLPPTGITQSKLFLSSQEITCKQFNQFRIDKQLQIPKNNQEPQNPITNVSVADAADFCNWLSKKEGLSNCYKIDENNNLVTKISCHFSMSGYRLPTDTEWLKGCRNSNSTSKFFFGDDHQRLKSFAFYRETKMSFVGLKKPNPCGLFDIYGNASEWCHATGDPQINQNWQIRGGDYDSRHEQCESAKFLVSTDCNQKTIFTGFRIIISIP
jgi:formylglycine-generating enzyme required for sulfatase activity